MTSKKSKNTYQKNSKTTSTKIENTGRRPSKESWKTTVKCSTGNLTNTTTRKYIGTIKQNQPYLAVT